MQGGFSAVERRGPLVNSIIPAVSRLLGIRTVKDTVTLAEGIFSTLQTDVAIKSLSKFTMYGTMARKDMPHGTPDNEKTEQVQPDPK